jgi:hypothetical protein
MKKVTVVGKVRGSAKVASRENNNTAIHLKDRSTNIYLR